MLNSFYRTLKVMNQVRGTYKSGYLFVYSFLKFKSQNYMSVPRQEGGTKTIMCIFT